MRIAMIAGPNGAGKTSFAKRLILNPDGEPELKFVNADDLARRLDVLGRIGPLRDRAGGRQMLLEIDRLVYERESFALETTLATLNYARRIPDWRDLGYSVSLTYLRLPNVETSIARVRRRVHHGGHDIPEDTIRRRFAKSLDYLERIYKPIVDDWYIYDSREGEFVLESTWQSA
ncbi:MAG: zeta toxin family protein [Hyphomicrobium sp.]